LTLCKLGSSLQSAKQGERFQFQRLGYFCVDTHYTTEDKLVFNRTVSLKDSWAKKNNNQPKQNQPNPNKQKKKKDKNKKGKNDHPQGQNPAKS